MRVQNIIGSNVVRVQCETEIYKNEVGLHNLERLFKNHSGKAVEIIGKVDTSLTSPIPIQMLPGLENLIGWVEKQIMLVAPNFVDYTPTGFEFDLKRTWANKMFKGSKVLPHTHDVISETGERNTNDSRIVSIFYYQLPEGSSDLVFMQDNEVVNADVKEGELVFHTKDILHAVTEHKSDIPRICLVFEFTYVQ